MGTAGFFGNTWSLGSFAQLGPGIRGETVWAAGVESQGTGSRRSNVIVLKRRRRGNPGGAVLIGTA